MSERTASARELARRIGISHTAIQKAERTGRIAREPDGTWDVDKARRHLTETALPGRSPLAPPAEASPWWLMVPKNPQASFWLVGIWLVVLAISAAPAWRGLVPCA